MLGINIKLIRRRYLTIDRGSKVLDMGLMGFGFKGLLQVPTLENSLAGVYFYSLFAGLYPGPSDGAPASVGRLDRKAG